MIVIFNKCRRNMKKCLNLALIMLNYSFIDDFGNGFIGQMNPYALTLL